MCSGHCLPQGCLGSCDGTVPEARIAQVSSAVSHASTGPWLKRVALKSYSAPYSCGFSYIPQFSQIHRYAYISTSLCMLGLYLYVYTSHEKLLEALGGSLKAGKLASQDPRTQMETSAGICTENQPQVWPPTYLEYWPRIHLILGSRAIIMATLEVQVKSSE